MYIYFTSVFIVIFVFCYKGGSFRQFLWQIARELQGSHLKMLVPCNNTSNKGKCLLKPGNMTFSEEKLLHFFGQVSTFVQIY